jgi:hypothetical protein
MWFASEHGRSSARTTEIGKATAPAASRKPVICGKITEMVDCRWSARFAPPASVDVVLGQILVLTSGRLTIQFNGGVARVTLDGPAIFQVVGLKEGYLLFGRLRCCSAIRPESGGLPIPGEFFIRTPGSIMRDRGAEFAVEVDNHGTSSWQFARGQIELCYPEGCVGDDQIRLTKSNGWVYWAREVKEHHGRLTLFCGTGQPPLGLAALLLNKNFACERRSAGATLLLSELKAAGKPLPVDKEHVGDGEGGQGDGIGAP